MNGKALPHDHPFWQKNSPPGGFNCRCTVMSLSGQELKRDGISVIREDLPDVFDKGFGTNPARGLTSCLACARRGVRNGESGLMCGRA